MALFILLMNAHVTGLSHPYSTYSILASHTLLVFTITINSALQILLFVTLVAWFSMHNQGPARFGLGGWGRAF